MVPVRCIRRADVVADPEVTVRIDCLVRLGTVLSAVGSTVTVAVELPALKVTVPAGGVKLAAPLCV